MVVVLYSCLSAQTCFANSQSTCSCRLRDTQLLVTKRRNDAFFTPGAKSAVVEGMDSGMCVFYHRKALSVAQNSGSIGRDDWRAEVVQDFAKVSIRAILQPDAGC